MRSGVLRAGAWGLGAGRGRVWLRAIRVHSFTASIVPIMVGGAMAVVDRAFEGVLFVVMLVASVACHAGCNLGNDYNDHRRGIDTAESLGPSQVIQKGLLTPAAVRNGMLVVFGIATLLGLWIVLQTGWPILAVALASLAAAYFYTGGPKPLGYLALGEVTVFLFMGPVMVLGAYYVLSGRLTWAAALASLPIGLLVAAILHANNVRDIELDRAKGKVTLATLLGRRTATTEYTILVGGAYVATALLVLADGRLWPVVMTALTLPVAARLSRLIRAATDTVTLNVVLRRTAGLHLQFGLLLTAGLLASAVLDRLQ